MRSAFAPLAVFALALPAHADLWIVDDDGGAGVDFTTIEAALAVADDGDEVLVREGDYAPAGSLLEVASGITLKTDPLGADVTIDGTLVVRDLAGDTLATVQFVDVPCLHVRDCDGAVIVDVVTTGELVVEHSAYVRAIHVFVLGGTGCSGPAPCDGRAVLVRDAYAEFVDVEILAASDLAGGALDGDDALRIEAGGVVRYDSGLADGGIGGDSDCLSPGPAGDGGHGVVVEAGARLFVEEGSGAIGRGGGGGSACSSPNDGVAGADLLVRGHVQLRGPSLSDYADIEIEPGGEVVEDAFAPELACPTFASM